MKKLLVTGASGFIGSNTIQSLQKLDLEIHAATIDEVPDEGDIKWFKCNLLNDHEIEENISRIAPDILLHLAWATEPGQYNMASNFEWFTASVKLIDWFRRIGGKRIIIMGSGIEYDWSYGVCHEYKTPLKSHTLYGQCKSLLFQYLSLYSQKYDLSYAWPRVFFTFGPNENPKRLVPYVITQLLNDQWAVIQSGDLLRDYIYVKDIGLIITELIKSEFTGPVNIGTGMPMKIRDIEHRIGRALEKQDLIQFESNEQNPYRVVTANTEVLQSKLHYNTISNFDLAIKETIDYWKSKQT